MLDRRKFLVNALCAAGGMAVQGAVPAFGAVSTAVSKPLATKRIFELALERAQLAKIYEGRSWEINLPAQHIKLMTEQEIARLYRTSLILRKLKGINYPNIEKIVDLAEEQVFGKNSVPERSSKKDHSVDLQHPQDNSFAYEALLHDGFQASPKVARKFPEPSFI